MRVTNGWTSALTIDWLGGHRGVYCVNVLIMVDAMKLYKMALGYHMSAGQLLL